MDFKTLKAFFVKVPKILNLKNEELTLALFYCFKINKIVRLMKTCLRRPIEILY